MAYYPLPPPKKNLVADSQTGVTEDSWDRKWLLFCNRCMSSEDTFTDDRSNLLNTLFQPIWDFWMEDQIKVVTSCSTHKIDQQETDG